MHPKKVILAYPPTHEREYETLRQLFSRRGIPVIAFRLDNAWNIHRLKQQFSELLVAHSDDSLMLNVSGGNRVMGIAAYEVFNQAGLPVFSVNLPDDKIIWLNQDKAHLEIDDKIKLKEFLFAFGADTGDIFKVNQSRQLHKEFTDELIAGIELFSRPLGSLNWLAAKASSDMRSPPLSKGQQADKVLIQLIKLFQSNGLLELSDGFIQFPSEQARFFVNGGWLEDHTFDTLLSSRKELRIQDAAQGMEIMRSINRQQIVKNELDVCFLSNNRLHVIECKTKRFHQANHADSPGAETLYKLDTLADILGGAHGKGMLVSYLPLSNWDRQRAKNLQIEVCAASELKTLGQSLKRWVLS